MQVQEGWRTPILLLVCWEDDSVRVCLICIELFGFGIHGGFGKSTRLIGRELAKRGVKVTVIVPRRSRDYPDEYTLDGMTVRQFNPLLPGSDIALYRSCNADVYHSQNTSLGTFLAMATVPGRRHMITFRDPMDRQDWKIESALSGKGRVGWYCYRMYIDNPLVGWAVRHAHGLYCAAEFLIPKVMRKYRFTHAPRFLPTPVVIPDIVSKAERPTVCFVNGCPP